MMTARQAAFLLFVLPTCWACSGAQPRPPRTELVDVNPLLRDEHQTLLVVDACINRKDANGNYYVIEESLEVARQVVNEAQKYLDFHDIHVDATLIPFACGALLDPANPPLKIAQKIDAELAEAQQPFAVPGEAEVAPATRDALCTVATNSFCTVFPSSSGPQPSSQEELLRTTRLVAEETGADSLLYLGIRGVNLSGGVRMMRGIARFMVGMATGITTGVAFIPGGGNQGSATTAALYDLTTGKQEWSGWLRVARDPLESEQSWTPETMAMLLDSAVYREAF